MARSHVMVWTGALVAALLAAGAAGNCGSRCTDTTFRGYTSCLQNCGANVAVTTCDCSAMACARCPGDNPCCQTCCNQKQPQCVCSNVNCQQPCNNACCSTCCQQPVEQSQCGNCASGCQQPGSACSPCCQQQQQQQQQTTTTARPWNPSQPPPPPSQQVIYVNVSMPPQPPNVVNVSLGNITVQPANITVLPASISITPNITVVVNTSPISQVYPYQYGGNVSLSIQQQLPQLPQLNCTGGRRRCCRVVMAPPYPCNPGTYCPPIVRMGCGDQCSTIIQQPVYYQPAPRPTIYYYPVYYYRPVYVYVPQTPQFFCSSGCMPTPTWPFARCFDTPGSMPYSAGGVAGSMPYSTGGVAGDMPYSAGGVAGAIPYSAGGVAGAIPFSTGGVAGSMPFSTGGVAGAIPFSADGVTGSMPFSPGGVAGAIPFSAGGVAGSMPFSTGGVAGAIPFSVGGVPSIPQYGSPELAPEAAAAASAAAINAQG